MFGATYSIAYGEPASSGQPPSALHLQVVG